MDSTRFPSNQACSLLAIELLSLWLLTSTPRTSASTESTRPRITILVFNYSTASRHALDTAKRETTWILSQAGVSAMWLECPVPLKPDSDNSCTGQVGLGNIRVRILERRKQDVLADGVFGVALAPIFVSVYYQSAVRLAEIDNSEFDAPIILGGVIAHEIGHLLLGPNSHWTAGIMQSPWKRKELNQVLTRRLVFTNEQARIIAAQAQNRLRPQVTNITEANMKSDSLVRAPASTASSKK